MAFIVPLKVNQLNRLDVEDTAVLVHGLRAITVDC